MGPLNDEKNLNIDEKNNKIHTKNFTNDKKNEKIKLNLKTNENLNCKTTCCELSA